MSNENHFFVNPSDIDEIVERVGNDVQYLAGKRILLAGGCGFLGRYFLEVFASINAKVLSQPVAVVAMDNLITAANVPDTFSKDPNLEFVEHNVIEPCNLGGAFDHIIHAAGIASPYYYRAQPLATLDVAITGTRNLLELARESRSHFIYFSSSEIYGDPDSAHVPTPESYNGNVSCVGPRACYDEGKRVGETLCHIYHHVHGVPVNVIRPFNVYGPGMKERDFRVLPNFASRIKGGQPLQIYGTGKQTRTYCYITDAMTGFLKVLLLGAPGETFNIGNPHPEISVQNLVKAMETFWAEPSLAIRWNTQTVILPMSRSVVAPNIRKANLQLEYQPEVELEDGLGRFLNWTQQHYKAVNYNGEFGANWRRPLGRNYIRTLAALPGVRLAAVASRNPETAELAGPETQICTHWESILDLNLDGLILAVPPTVQPAIALRAIKADMPLLLEKPMALDPALANEIANQARARNVYVAVNHIYLHHPAYLQLKQRLAVTREPITAIRTYSGNFGPFRTDWNSLWDWGPHDVSLALDLTGGPAIVDQAHIKTHDSDQPGAGNYSINLSLPNGVHAQLKFGNQMPRRIRQLSVTTTTGKYMFDDEAENCLTFRTSEKDIVFPVSEERPLDNAVCAFTQGVRKRGCDGASLTGFIEVVEALAQAEKMANG